MEALSAGVQESGDGRSGFRRLEKLKVGRPDGHERHADPLTFHGFRRGSDEPQGLPVALGRSLNGTDSNA
jgi:hypothetical protein